MHMTLSDQIWILSMSYPVSYVRVFICVIAIQSICWKCFICEMIVSDEILNLLVLDSVKHVCDVHCSDSSYSCRSSFGDIVSVLPWWTVCLFAAGALSQWLQCCCSVTSLQAFTVRWTSASSSMLFNLEIWQHFCLYKWNVETNMFHFVTCSNWWFISGCFWKS